jgi:hypothetical protein
LTERHQRIERLDRTGSAPAQPHNAGCPELTTVSTDPCPVVDTWPDIIPVTPAEIDVLETFLGELLDEIRASARSDQ